MTTTINRMLRVRAVVTRHRHDPYLCGRALQVAGAALVADGFVGLENPLDGRNKRAGIFGALLIAGIGAVFLFFASMLLRTTDPYPDGLTTVGTITEVDRGTGENSNTCSGTVAYTVADRRYQVRTSSSSTTLCSKQGTTVDVSYRPSTPAAGRAQLPGDHTLLRVVQVAGWTVLVLGALQALVRLTELLVGGWALIRGRRLVATHPATPADAILEELRAAWSGTTAVPHRT